MSFDKKDKQNLERRHKFSYPRINAKKPGGLNSLNKAPFHSFHEKEGPSKFNPNSRVR
jgi:hypothetical protein